MPDFLPVPPTSSVTDAQTRAVLDALSQNIQVAIQKFAATGTVANTSVSAARGGLNSFGVSDGAVVNNNTNMSAAYTKNNMIADSAALFAAKLNKAAADILSGPIDFTTYGGFKTSGMTIASDGTATGQGVAFTSKGIVGRNSATTTFTLDSTTGDANFYGNISGGANINITGNGTFNGNSGSAPASLGTGAVIANATNTTNSGVVGYGSGVSIFSQGYGVVGYANNSYSGGVYGYATAGLGVQGVASGSGGVGVQAANTSGGTGLSVIGPMTISSTSFVNNLYANYTYYSVLSTGALLYFYTGPATGASTATFNGSNKPGSLNSTNSWLEVIINGVSYQVPMWRSN